MPPISAMAIGHLLEHNSPTPKRQAGETNRDDGRVLSPAARVERVAPRNPPPAPALAQPHHFWRSLYSTPHAAPIPASSPSTSPTHLVLNRTRGGSGARFPTSNAPLHESGDYAETTGGTGEEGRDSATNEGSGYSYANNGCLGEEEGVEDEEDFYDPRETMSTGSSSEAEEARRGLFLALNTSQSSYYDAGDDLSDGSFGHSPSFSRDHDTGLHALTANILEEVEKRQKAEKELIQLRTQWQMMKDGLSQVGISFPEIQSNEEQFVSVAQSFCQELVVGRDVCDAVERSIARAETEELAKSIIDTKNYEISRLQDRLQYYETVNHEMSQRNLEIAEVTRRKRLRRWRRQTLLWSFFGFSVAIGASLLAYYYLPDFKGKEVSQATSDSCDASELITSLDE